MLGALPSEGWTGCGRVERGWRQHSSEVTPFKKEGTEQGCEGENCRVGGLKLEEISDSNGKTLNIPLSYLASLLWVLGSH